MIEFQSENLSTQRRRWDKVVHRNFLNFEIKLTGSMKLHAVLTNYRKESLA